MCFRNYKWGYGARGSRQRCANSVTEVEPSRFRGPLQTIALTGMPLSGRESEGERLKAAGGAH